MKNIKLNELFIKQRNILGLTQEDVAEKLGFSVQTISRWEKGEYLNDIDTIKMLCDFYNIEVKDSLFMPKKESIIF